VDPDVAHACSGMYAGLPEVILLSRFDGNPGFLFDEVDFCHSKLKEAS
jgi:hypothetical protein